jgi:catechol 2,3-dioxygenase-like lactoylglutathione lyase family enzyme
LSEITDLYAGVPVTDLDVSIDWYTRFFGRPPDMRAGDEILWDLADHATLFIEPNPGVRHTKVPDPDGNALALAAAPEAA